MLEDEKLYCSHEWSPQWEHPELCTLAHKRVIFLSVTNKMMATFVEFRSTAQLLGAFWPVRFVASVRFVQLNGQWTHAHLGLPFKCQTITPTHFKESTGTIWVTNIPAVCHNKALSSSKYFGHGQVSLWKQQFWTSVSFCKQTHSDKRRNIPHHEQEMLKWPNSYNFYKRATLISPSSERDASSAMRVRPSKHPKPMKHQEQ